jgi:hypothetical protein
LNKWYTVDEWGRKDDEDWDELFSCEDNEETSGEDGLMDEIEPRPLEDKVQGREAIALRNLTEH